MQFMFRFCLLFVSIWLMACSQAGYFGKAPPYDPYQAAVESKQRAEYNSYEHYRERKVIQGLGGEMMYYH